MREIAAALLERPLEALATILAGAALFYGVLLGLHVIGG